MLTFCYVRTDIFIFCEWFIGRESLFRNSGVCFYLLQGLRHVCAANGLTYWHFMFSTSLVIFINASVFKRIMKYMEIVPEE